MAETSTVLKAGGLNFDQIVAGLQRALIEQASIASVERDGVSSALIGDGDGGAGDSGSLPHR